MITDYNTRKQEVLEIIDKVKSDMKSLTTYFASINQPNPVDRVNRYLEAIQSKECNILDDRFRIVVAGEAKSGKSTFINAYLGIELLPMDVKQCTSSIIEIKYGHQFKINALYANGNKKTIVGEENCIEFLRNNAALDDAYRDIPVPTINEEILVKSGQRSKGRNNIVIKKNEIDELLNATEIIEANIYNLPIQKYKEKILNYINNKKDEWYNIVTKIEVFFPLPDSLKGVEIVDSPGVCARGGVSEIAERYIKNADAIIFLKPISGQALESTQFNYFLRNMSVERNRNALFLILTRASNVNALELRRLEEEAYKQFNMLNQENILIVDSKAELYVKTLSSLNTMEEIKSKLKCLNERKSLDDFVKAAYFESAKDFDDGDKNDFINALKDKSRFSEVYNALDRFGRNAHYILLNDVLDICVTLYNKIISILKDQIKLYKQKNEDPKELEHKINEINSEIENIENKMWRGIDQIIVRYKSDSGLINNSAKKMLNEYISKINDIAPDASFSLQELEKISMKTIDEFNEFNESIQKQLLNEFDETLIKLSDKTTVSFTSIKPELLNLDFDEILESKLMDANVVEVYQEGLTFTTTKTRSIYSKEKHFKLIRDNIYDRLEQIKYDLVNATFNFIDNLKEKYQKELKSNIHSKQKELYAIKEAKINAESIIEIISQLTGFESSLIKNKDNVEPIKGGINRCIKR